LVVELVLLIFRVCTVPDACAALAASVLELGSAPKKDTLSLKTYVEPTVVNVCLKR